jgi:dsDNA-specific endonuclease/ATPase MutS2
LQARALGVAQGLQSQAEGALNQAQSEIEKIHQTLLDEASAVEQQAMDAARALEEKANEATAEALSTMDGLRQAYADEVATINGAVDKMKAEGARAQAIAEQYRSAWDGLGNDLRNMAPPDLPEAPAMPEMPSVPEMPPAPELPSF